MIRIGTRISPDWLERDHDLRFLKQIGVDYVDITLDMVVGYVESGGQVDRAGLARLVDRLDAQGLKIERANYLNAQIDPWYLNTVDRKAVIGNVADTLALLGEFDIPVMGLQTFVASALLGREIGCRSWDSGRGGYRYLHVDVSEDAREAPLPPGAPSREMLWERTIDLYRSLLPAAEQANVKVAQHGNDPPIPNAAGVPQILCDYADFERLFRDAPSPNNGMTFCVGTRYETGADVLDGIRRFGAQKKIFHVHFRNVRGTIPSEGAYSEVAPDDGDMDMFQVARALQMVGYDGVLDYDHIMRIERDDAAGRQYMAYCVGHMKGILAGIQ